MTSSISLSIYDVNIARDADRSYDKVVTRYDVSQNRQRTWRRSISGKKWKVVGTGYRIVTINDRIVLSLEITLILPVGLTKVYPFKNCSLHIYERSFRCNHIDVARNLTEEKQRLMPLIIAFPYINGRIHPRDWTEIWQTANVRSRYRSIPT